MDITFDPALLARIQFAFTVSFHIIFPAFTIGLASWLAMLEWRWLKTNNPVYKELYQMWIKIFAVAFGMGVVSGVVMSYQFGTNWSVFSDKIGSVIGPLLGYEVLTAFFLEASFLGIMLFGWDKVSRRMHFTATLVVAIGTLISAFWILSANSWMHTPTGFTIGDNGLLSPTNWLEIIFNPSFPYRFTHMITAAYLTTAFAVGGVGAYYLLRKPTQDHPHAKKMLGMALIMAVIFSPIQLILGDLHGLNTLKYQPAKVAAMEGIWETETGAGLRLFAIPDSDAEKNTHEVILPNMASLILTHDMDGTIKGLMEWPKEERPPVGIVFWSFRIMVGIGLLMILTAIFALYLHTRQRLFITPWFQRWCIGMAPSGFIAVLAGWFVTEVGRQPYVVYDVLKTNDVISPVIGEHVAISLGLFVFIYTFVFGMGLYYMLKLIRKGPGQPESEQFYSHSEEHTFVDAITHNTTKQEG